MMLRHMDQSQHAALVENAVLRTIRDGKARSDILVHNWASNGL